MINKSNYIGLYTIVRREWLRMIRIAGQVFLPPVITMSLYFVIFGRLIGSRVGQMHGVDYPVFIAPGLIMMSVIMNAYSNVSSSFYSHRFQHSIEEILVSPIPNHFILLGYIAGGVLRGLIIAALVTLVTSCFIPFHLVHPIATFFSIFLVACFFALCGFTNAMLARNFDDIAIIPTFVLTPLTYLGGVFYSVAMLPPFWSYLSTINPIVYMVSIFRYSMIGVSDINFLYAFFILVSLNAAMFSLNLYLLNRGVGLKE